MSLKVRKHNNKRGNGMDAVVCFIYPKNETLYLATGKAYLSQYLWRESSLFKCHEWCWNIVPLSILIHISRSNTIHFFRKEKIRKSLKEI